MFSSFTNRLQEQVDTIKAVLDTHDSLRNIIFWNAEPASGPENAGIQQAIDAVKRRAPSKPAWQIYDHCAAFTRLYAVYEQFVENLASEYLRMLPRLYVRYEDLPPTVTTQHRVGVAQILQKIGKDGPYKDLEERSIIRDLAHGLLGNPNYTLLRNAFLIDPQNYRSEIVNKLFSYLGFGNSWVWVEKHPLMVAFMQSRRDPNETAATLLHDFVEYRNEASHTLVGDIVATEEIKSIADFVVVLSETLSQLVMKNAVQRRKELGEVSTIGVVVHKFSDRIVGARMSAGAVAIGNPLVVMQKQACFRATIESIQILQTPYDHLETQDDQEIGLGLTEIVNEGAELLRLPPDEQPSPMPVIESFSPDDFPTQTENPTQTNLESPADPGSADSTSAPEFS